MEETLWNWYVAISSLNSWYADIFLLNTQSDWNSLFTFAQKDASCLHVGTRHSWMCHLSQWSNLSLIITYDNSNSIKIEIWLILDNSDIYSTIQLSAVCVISIISLVHLDLSPFFKSTLRSWDPIVANPHYLWPNVYHIQDKRLHICGKHFVTSAV